MGLLLKEALRRLCVEIGWSNAVFWKAIGCQSPMNLVWEDGHYEKTKASVVPCISGFKAIDLPQQSQDDRFADLGCQAEDRVGMLVKKMMVPRVHVVGDGIVGRAAFTGNHQWILRHSLDDCGSVSKGLAEMNHQFLAGIQTIAIIPVLPYGVIQLGSTQMVIENIGFVNHVKNLFVQLQCVPGALLSDVNQKALIQKIQVHASLGIPVSADRSGDVCNKIDRFLPSVGDEYNHQLFKSPATRHINQPSCSLSTELFQKTPNSAIGVSLTSKQSITTTTRPLSDFFQSINNPAFMPVCHLNSQLESGLVGAQVIFSNPDVRFNQHPLPHDSSYGIQHQPTVVTSGVSSSSLTVVEDQLSHTSAIGSRESTDNSKPTLNNTKTLQPRCHGSTLPSSLNDSIIVSLLSKNNSLYNGNDFGGLGSLPCGTIESIRIQCANSSIMGAPRLLNQINSSDSSHMLSGGTQSIQPSTNKNTEIVSTATNWKIENDLFQALDIKFTEPDTDGSGYMSVLGTPEVCWLSSSNTVPEIPRCQSAVCDGNDTYSEQNRQAIHDNVEPKPLHGLNEKTSTRPVQRTSGNDLFDVLGLEYKAWQLLGGLDDVLVPKDAANAQELSSDMSTCITQLEMGPAFDELNADISCCAIYSDSGPDQLLDAVVSKIKSDAKWNSADNLSCKTSLTRTSGSSLHSSPAYGWVASSEQMQHEFSNFPSVLIKTEKVGSSSIKSSCSMDKTGECSQRDGEYKSQLSQWVENGQNMKCDSVSAASSKRVDETGKVNRKRPRPGESPKPRPKDRQMIQDRVKELREIVPNGAKCSIDALLEKTIRHMVFLQSVTKHADKLKETGEPKIINREGGLLLKDNFEGGATWAFEVGTRSMVCPIIVEDLNPPRQMLVEMLCEEQGFFLEIADLIRGMGLTILKGVMEARNDKFWARFAVEANRDVTRMDIFLSLVRLIEPTTGSNMTPPSFGNINMPHKIFHQSSIPVTGLSDHLL